uniref:Uncharacterized protein n=1 Tax=Arundo donax TaxID=35708 RepID=A0A0A9E0W6_ARUDO
MYNSLGSGGSGEHETGATSTQSEYANLYDLRTYSSTSNPLTLNSILHIKSRLMANDMADTPKKNPDGELSSEALAPTVT